MMLDAIDAVINHTQCSPHWTVYNRNKKYRDRS